MTHRTAMLGQPAGTARTVGTVTTSRLEAFSDGVLAIAITLLVIEIHPPDIGEGETLAHALWRQWPSYAAYLVSFLTIGVIWLNHHRIFTQVIRVDGPLLLLNLNLLLWTALIPLGRCSPGSPATPGCWSGCRQRRLYGRPGCGSWSGWWCTRSPSRCRGCRRR